MLGLDELRRLAVDLRARVDQVGRVELVAAVVALVAARAVVPADRAGALDVAVGQRPPGGRADRAHRRPGEHVAVAVQRGEELLHDLVVVRRGRAGEQVVAQPEALQVVDDHAVVLVGELARGEPLGVGLHLDRGAVLVGARDHQHLVARHPPVAGEDVGGHTEAGDVADVPGAVGVGPRHGGQHAGTHATSLGSACNRISGAPIEGMDRRHSRDPTPADRDARLGRGRALDQHASGRRTAWPGSCRASASGSCRCTPRAETVHGEDRLRRRSRTSRSTCDVVDVFVNSRAGGRIADQALRRRRRAACGSSSG